MKEHRIFRKDWVFAQEFCTNTGFTASGRPVFGFCGFPENLICIVDFRTFRQLAQEHRSWLRQTNEYQAF
jgi:hypothetical protein